MLKEPTAERRSSSPSTRCTREGSVSWNGSGQDCGRIPRVTVYGPPPDRPRTPTVSFTVEGQDPGDVAAGLARAGVFVSHGDFYATTLVQRLAPQGFVRAGCACYTTEEEVERLIDGVSDLARR